VFAGLDLMLGLKPTPRPLENTNKPNQKMQLLERVFVRPRQAGMRVDNAREDHGTQNQGKSEGPGPKKMHPLSSRPDSRMLGHVVTGREELGSGVIDQRKNRNWQFSQRNGLTKNKARSLRSMIPLRRDR